MSKTRQAIENWFSGDYKNVNQAALAAGCKSSAPVYRALSILENNPRVCPCCEMALDKRFPLPEERFDQVRVFLDNLEE